MHPGRARRRFARFRAVLVLENAPNPHGTRIAGEYEPSGVLAAKEHKNVRKLVAKHFVRSERSPE